MFSKSSDVRISLWEAILAANFGRNSLRPRRAAYWRLAGVLIAALCLSWLLARGIAGIPVDPLANTGYLALISAFAMQAIVLFALVAAMGIARITSTALLTRLLVMLPLTAMQRWMAFLLPSFIVAITAAIAAAWPLALLMHQLGTPPTVFALSSLGGMLSALGVIHGIPRKQRWLLIGLPFLLYGEYTLLGTARASTMSGKGAFLLLCLLFAAGWLLLVRSTTVINQDSTAAERGGHVRGIALPTSIWLCKKILRSPTTQVGLVATAAMSTTLFFVLKPYQPEPQLYALFAAILSAAFASDIRSLCRRSRPAEIAALRATARFVLAHTVIASLFCLAAVAPLIVGMFGAAGTVNEYLYAAIQLGLGIAIGVCAGTLVAPGQRDVLGQLIATLSCTGVLVALPFLPGVRSQSNGTLAILEGILICICLCTAFAFELHRNYYLWRKSA